MARDSTFRGAGAARSRNARLRDSKCSLARPRSRSPRAASHATLEPPSAALRLRLLTLRYPLCRARRGSRAAEAAGPALSTVPGSEHAMSAACAVTGPCVPCVPCPLRACHDGGEHAVTAMRAVTRARRDCPCVLLCASRRAVTTLRRDHGVASSIQKSQGPKGPLLLLGRSATPPAPGSYPGGSQAVCE